MPGRWCGLILGAIVTATVPLFLTGGGASVVFPVPLLALVLLPGCILIGLLIERSKRRRRVAGARR